MSDSLNTTITDFKAWLDGLDLEDFNDVYSLYRAVQDCDDWGTFTCTKHESADKWFVKELGSDVTLLLASEKARDYFLEHLTRTNCGELEMEGWYAYHHAMEKED